MIIARLHRGGIYESMETAKTFETVQEMKQWFVDKRDKAFSIDDVVIDERITFDDRIKWNTQYVCTERYMDKDYMELYGSPQCIGMCDMNYTQK